MQMNRIRSPYKTTKDITAYVEQEKGFAVVPQPIKAGITIFAAVADDGHTSAMGTRGSLA
jgi:hypothetical protein